MLLILGEKKNWYHWLPTIIINDGNYNIDFEGFTISKKKEYGISGFLDYARNRNMNLDESNSGIKWFVKLYQLLVPAINWKSLIVWSKKKRLALMIKKM